MRSLVHIVLLTFAATLSAADHFDQNLNEHRFLSDALDDAKAAFPDRLPKFGIPQRFEVDRGFTVDLDDNGEMEFVVSGTVTGLDLEYVMVYIWKNDAWSCQILNRGSGGNLAMLDLIDLEGDGVKEIISIVKDEQLRQHCRINAIDKKTMEFSTVFSLDTPGGLMTSDNILVAQFGKQYKIRIDEVRYPDTEDGAVEQQTIWYCYRDGQFKRE